MSACTRLSSGLPLAFALALALGAAPPARADEYGALPKSWDGPSQPTPGSSAAPPPDFRKLMREASPLGSAEAAEPPAAPAPTAAPEPAAAAPPEAAPPTTQDPAPPPGAQSPSAAAAGSPGAATPAGAPEKREPAAPPLQRGLAAWYQHKGVTANGEVYNPDALTAAHRTLPLGARLRIRFEKTGKDVVVRINDRVSRKALQRRPLAIELSRASAAAIGLTGVGEVAIYPAD